jgi:serine/threonine-protein kinase
LVARQQEAAVHPFEEQGKLVAGRYEVARIIASGSVGVVFLARDKQTYDYVALKSLLPKRLDPHTFARFGREAMVLKTLDHPNIIRYLDHGIDPESRAPFLVTELIQGTPTEELVAREPPLMPWEQHRILHQLFGAVAHLHDHGIIHRDLKWSNVLVVSRKNEPLTTKLIDFGLLKYGEGARVQDKRRLTATDVMVGTPHYASPEQIQQIEDLDRRSDIYSLGVMTYELVTGRKPFSGRGAIETCMLHLNQPPPPPESVAAGRYISPALSAAILKALAKAPSDRHQEVVAFWAALEAAL